MYSSAKHINSYMSILILILEWVLVVFFITFSIKKLFQLWFQKSEKTIYWVDDNGSEYAPMSKISRYLVYLWLLWFAVMFGLNMLGFHLRSGFIFLIMIPFFALILVSRFCDGYVFRKQMRDKAKHHKIERMS